MKTTKKLFLILTLFFTTNQLHSKIVWIENALGKDVIVTLNKEQILLGVKDVTIFDTNGQFNLRVTMPTSPEGESDSYHGIIPSTGVKRLTIHSIDEDNMLIVQKTKKKFCKLTPSLLHLNNQLPAEAYIILKFDNGNEEYWFIPTGKNSIKIHHELASIEIYRLVENRRKYRRDREIAAGKMEIKADKINLQRKYIIEPKNSYGMTLRRVEYQQIASTR